MTKSNTVKIVVVGGGLIGPRHASHINKSSETELFGIIDPMSKTEEIAKNLNTIWFKSISHMVEYCNDMMIPLPDGAIVATPNHTHIKVSAELASHGIHLLVEKPLSSTPEESKALQEYAKIKNVQLLVGHHRRFNPFIVETKKNLHRVGKIIAIQGTWTLKKPDSYFEIGDWRKNETSGGGALMINLVHDLDLLQYLFGPIEKIYAELLEKQRDFSADEGAVLTIKFKSGVSGTFICSDNVTSPFNFETGTGENPTIPFDDGLQGLYRIFGTQGTLSMPDMTLFHQPEARTNEENSWLNPISKYDLINDRQQTLYSKLPFDLQLDHFVSIIRGKQLPFCTADDGMSALLCIKAVSKSIKTGLPQYVQDIEDIKPNYDCLGLDIIKLQNQNQHKQPSYNLKRRNSITKVIA